MTPTVANLKPAISLFLTNVSTPTQRRIRTCAVIAKAVGTTTISAIKSHNGRLDRKCDTLALHANVMATWSSLVAAHIVGAIAPIQLTSSAGVCPEPSHSIHCAGNDWGRRTFGGRKILLNQGAFWHDSLCGK